MIRLFAQILKPSLLKSKIDALKKNQHTFVNSDEIQFIIRDIINNVSINNNEELKRIKQEYDNIIQECAKFIENEKSFLKDIAQQKITDLKEHRKQSKLTTQRQNEAFDQDILKFEKSCDDIIKSSISVQEKIEQIQQKQTNVESKKRFMINVAKLIKTLTEQKEKAEQNSEDIELPKQIQELIQDFENLSIQTNNNYADVLHEMNNRMDIDDTQKIKETINKLNEKIQTLLKNTTSTHKEELLIIQHYLWSPEKKNMQQLRLHETNISQLENKIEEEQKFEQLKKLK